MKVTTFEISTTDGPRFGLKNVNTGDVLHGATAKWRTRKGAEGYAKRRGFELA